MVQGKLRWGMLGCGDVTEVKSGPAFNKVDNSELVAVMRRNAALAQDYALRHAVPNWYDEAGQLISNAEVDAIYIATPPSSHIQLAMQCAEAGKPVYIEKPVSISVAEAEKFSNFLKEKNLIASVAHYRRMQPKFLYVEELLDSDVIGSIESVRLIYNRTPLSEADVKVPKTAWRVQEAEAGNGLLYDIAPHQLDLLYYYFGKAISVTGSAKQTQQVYNAADTYDAQIIFENGIVADCVWNFNAGKNDVADLLVFTGTHGKISFTVFDDYLVHVENGEDKTTKSFEVLQHVQQPMIAAVTQYFLGKGKNPCTLEEAIETLRWMEIICRKA